MYNSKLVEIFNSFSPTEQNRLKKFVHSPYHNKHEEVNNLLDYLINNERYSMKFAFDWVFPNQDYRPQKIRNTMSYLQKLIDKFLIYEALEDENDISSKLLLAAYRRRKLDKCFRSTMRYSQEAHQKKVYRAAEYYYQHYQLQEEQFLFAETKQRLEAKNLQEVLDSFDVYYMVNKLEYCLTALTHQNIFSTTYDLHMVPAILQNIEDNKLLEIPVIAVYYYSYKALVNSENTAAFFQLKKLLLHEADIFKTDGLKKIYLIAINFCIKHLNMGDEGFIEEIYELYKLGLESKVFIEDGQLSRFTYKNIVATGLKAKDYNWVRDFIDHYAPLLPGAYRESYKDYNLAKWYYSNKNYKEAMRIFLMLENTDRIVVMDSKVTLLKIYYELEEYDALDSLLDSFKVYIRRNKEVSAYLKKSYLNLIKYIRKALNLNPYNTEAKQNLIESIQTEPQLPERSWILGLLK